ncbi:VanW family protein [Desulfosporosinus sp. SB140]|uniref:VanW family protein n=1 Tax=Desulfosporosinus paludis TaxID=3115649 RepID=UPI00388E4AEE
MIIDVSEKDTEGVNKRLEKYRHRKFFLAISLIIAVSASFETTFVSKLSSASIPSIQYGIKQTADQKLVKQISLTNITVNSSPKQGPKATKTSITANDIIGEFSTKFNVKEKNRSINLTLAARALNNKVIYPGKVFSFNNIVGERTLKNGYKDAYILNNNRYIPALGGGICQVSSTLYNAVLLADLQIIERVPHQVPIIYVPLGQDATVYYPKIDFKFKNNTSSPIYIRSKVQSGLLTLQIYGKKTGKIVQIKPQILKTIRGRAGSKGYIVKTWKIVKDSQGNVNKSMLSRDIYAPLKKN